MWLFFWHTSFDHIFSIFFNSTSFEKRQFALTLEKILGANSHKNQVRCYQTEKKSQSFRKDIKQHGAPKTINKGAQISIHQHWDESFLSYSLHDLTEDNCTHENKMIIRMQQAKLIIEVNNLCNKVNLFKGFDYPYSLSAWCEVLFSQFFFN